MTHSSVRHPLVRAQQAMRKRMASTTEDDSAGFTLIELIVVVAILPLVVGGIAVALISVFSLQNSVTNRVSDSNDALVSSSVFNRDVQSAQMMTTDPSPTDPAVPACGASGQTQLLGLEWGASTGFPGGYQHVVSYIETTVLNPQGTANVNALVRQICTNGAATTGYTTQRVSTDIGTPSVLISPSPQLISSQWVSTLGVTSIVVNVTEPGADFASAGGSSQTASDQYKFSLVGLPGRATSTGTPTDPKNDTGGQCSFASPGTGTYANQLCFVDFTNLPNIPTSPTSTAYCGSSTAKLMTMGITDTADTLEMCVTTSGAPVAPHAIPTYYNAGGLGGSEAFLGNNGFYTGVPATIQPALYQTQQTGTSTITFSNIQVLDSSGNPASGWTMVTGDAETTDTGEWMNFKSNLNWSILPNNGASDLWGDDCYQGASPPNSFTATSGVWAWTGASAPTNPISAANLAPLKIATSNGFTTGVNSILCQSDTSRNKTGTIMVQAQEPQGSTAQQSITVTMYGSGLEACFLAVLV